MHIFNLNNKPYLIISSKNLHFRHNLLDEQMQKYSFGDIKKITTIHRYNASKELFVWIRIQTRTQHAPFFIQLSSLDEPLEEVLDILRSELQGKIKLSLPKNSFLHTLRTRYKRQKSISLVLAISFLFLFAYHKFTLPSLELLKENALQVKLQKNSGFCSTRAKVAYTQRNSPNMDVNSYCGLFGTWSLQSSKEVPLEYLKAEFSDLRASDYLEKSRTYKNEKKYTEALIELQNVYYLERDHKQARILEADINYKIGNLDKALEIVNDLLLTDPSYEMYFILSNIYFHEKEYEKAYPALLKSIRLKQSPEAYTMLAFVEEKMGKEKLALQHYEQALCNNENDYFVLTRLGLLYWSSHKFEKAFTSLKKAYESTLENAALFLNYYEVSLVHPDKVPQEDKEKFLTNFKSDKQKLLVYEMLNVIELSIEGQETREEKEAWSKNFDGEKLDWSLKEIRSWLDQSDLTLDHQQEVQATIGFFIGYQQAYSLQHQNSLPKEIYQ